MVSVYDVKAEPLINAVAEELEEKGPIEKPKWAKFVNTGVNKERPPEQENWWYIRCAAVLRQVYIRGPIGVSRLRSLFGGKRNRGHQTEHFYKGSGKIIRTALQQLEEEGLLEKKKSDGKNLGRGMTSEGQSFLDQVSTEVQEE